MGAWCYGAPGGFLRTDPSEYRAYGDSLGKWTLQTHPSLLGFL